MCVRRKIALSALLTLLWLFIAILPITQAQTGVLSAISAIWSPDSRYIAFINDFSGEPRVEVFTADLRPVVTLRIDSVRPGINGYSMTRALAWSPDSRALAGIVIASGPDPLANSYVTVWNVDTWVVRFAEPYYAFELAWSPSSDYLGAGAFILDAMTGALVSQPVTFDPTDLQFSLWNPTNEQTSSKHSARRDIVGAIRN